jgi:hypothetical protein
MHLHGTAGPETNMPQIRALHNKENGDDDVNQFKGCQPHHTTTRQETRAQQVNAPIEHGKYPMYKPLRHRAGLQTACSKHSIELQHFGGLMLSPTVRFDAMMLGVVTVLNR